MMTPRSRIAIVPGLIDGSAPRLPNDLSQGSYFGGRKPEDGRIDWTKPAQQVYNLIRAVAPPYPGAFFDDANGRRFVVNDARLVGARAHDAHRAKVANLPPGLHLVDNAVFGVCGDARAIAIRDLRLDGKLVSADDWSQLSPHTRDS